jgi:hypothetical protein
MPILNWFDDCMAKIAFSGNQNYKEGETYVEYGLG